MAYVIRNPKTKKAAKEILAVGAVAKDVLFEPGVGNIPDNGTLCAEGPHSPVPHTWYVEVKIVGGKIVKIK